MNSSDHIADARSSLVRAKRALVRLRTLIDELAYEQCRTRTLVRLVERHVARALDAMPARSSIFDD